MGRKNPEAKAFRSYLLSNTAQDRLHRLSFGTRGDDDLDARKKLLEEAPLYKGFQDRTSITWKWPDFTAQALAAVQTEDPEFCEVLRLINSKAQLEKHEGVHVLNLRQRLAPLDEILKRHDSFESAAAEVKKSLGINLVFRERFYPRAQRAQYPGRQYHDYARSRPLVEVRLPNTPQNAILCDEANGFFIVEPDVSAVFVSQLPGGGFEIELAVMREVPSSDTVYTAPILDWLKAVIIEACSSRRDVRPTHTGKMVQVGLNMGPRHARILGWAKSFTKRLTKDEMVREDTNLIGAMSLLWSLVKARLPADITASVQKLLDTDYPPLATRNIPAGCGFSIEIDNVVYNFSTESRAPPEGIATGGYEAHTHTDPCVVKWAFGWTVARDIPDSCPLPPKMGSSYVDAGLRVVVRSAVGTLNAFQPNSLHGTTFTGGIVNYGLSMTSTRRVSDGIKELLDTGVSVKYCLDTDKHDEELESDVD